MKFRRFLLICMLILIPLSSISLHSYDIRNLKDNSANSKYFEIPFLSYDSPNSKPLLINQYATITNSFFPLSLPTNVSFTLAEGWTSKNVTIYYDGITHKKDYVNNGDFVSDSNGWNYRSNTTQITDSGWISDGYIRIKVKNSPLLANDYGYYEQNISIQESLTPNKFSILSLDYFYDADGSPTSDISFYLSVEMDGVEKNKTVYLTDLVELSWTSITIVYDPVSFGQNLPGNVSIRAGIFVENAVTPAIDQTIDLDNIKFETWTSINQKDLFTVYDNEFSSNYSYNNVTFGKGTTFIDTERSRNQTSDVIFTISKNTTRTEDLEVYNITITSNVMKLFNSTVGGLAGSVYSTNPNITWQTEFTINYPYNYLDNWVEIQKPSNWVVNHILDGYNVDRIDSCSGAGMGSETMIIPFEIINQGLWKIEAASANYITDGNFAVWNGTFYENSSILSYGDSFQIQAKLNDTITLDGTFIQCIIQYPNGSLFLNETLPASENVVFGNYSAYQNMIVGIYDVLLEWTNNDSYIMRDKIGFTRFNFTLYHNTDLKAVNSYYETMAGGPLLVKVNFTDSDIDTYIDFASITYNTTYGTKGNLAYLGSGIYVIDLDTSLLPLGDYYLSFNASKDYYQSQEIKDLIRIKIIAEPLLLEVPRTIINANANSFIKVQINLTGSTTGSYYWPANITSDWQQNYTIVDFSNGTWEFNISTFNLPTSGIPELYTITIFANKTGYGSTLDSIILKVNPISTLAHVNQTIVQIYPNHNFYLVVNYTIESSGELIAGANINIGWEASYNCSTIADGFQIFFNTSGLSVDYYPIYFELNHEGYETAFVVAYVMIIPAETQLVLLNPEPIEIVRGDMLNISCLYTSDGEDLINSTLNLIGDINGTFIWNGTEFYSTINTRDLESRSYLIQILASSQNFEPQLRDLIITVFPLDIKIQISSMTFRFEEGQNNIVHFSVYDESHNCLLAGFNVSYEYNEVSNLLYPGSNGTYQLDLNSLSLNPLVSYHSIKLTVSNPYGEDEFITIIVYTSSFKAILTISISVIISTVSIIALGVIINKRYIGVSKFQRRIRNVKRKLKKQKYDKISEPSKENIIRSLFDKQFKIPLKDKISKKFSIKEKR
ncbi:MAG: hypothetical protein ACFE8N_00230 [Promethearchaeota archaeon]